MTGPGVPVVGGIALPCMVPRMVRVEQVSANDYNPNSMVLDRRRLLKISIVEDGVTSGIVVVAEGEGYVVVDGFHRFVELRDYFGCSHVPVVVLAAAHVDRVVATVLHNRARGRHVIAGVRDVVARMAELGSSNEAIARGLGMGAEEVLRMRQEGGIAAHFAQRSYSRAWEWVDDGG